VGPPPLFAQAGHRVRFLSGVDRDVDILPDIEGDERLMGGGEYLRFVYETGFFTHLGTLYNRAAAIKIRFYTADINSSDMESLVRLALEGKVLIRNTLAGCWIIFWELTTSSLLREAIRMIWTSPALPKLSNRDSACMKLLDIGPPPSVGDELRCAAGKLLRCRPGLCRTFS
jgi:hypothetical protein